jgi:hypothetical protein
MKESNVQDIQIEIPLPLQPSTGHVDATPTPHLTPEQARTCADIYAGLADRGIVLNSQADVFGWILNQVAAAPPSLPTVA